MRFSRLLRHLTVPHWVVRRAFPAASLRAIEKSVAVAERMHGSELRFVAEAGLPFVDLWRDVSPRQRAVDIFSDLRVWDTEANSGVLIYVQLVDRRVEIVADRGVAAKVAQAEWDDICRGMERAFEHDEYQRGAIVAIDRIGRLLAVYFPARDGKRNELPDRPLMI